jgi:hypothetical protein
MSKTTSVTSVTKKDFSPKLKFALTLGSQITIGILGIATTAAVTIFLAKTLPEVEASE